MYEKIIGIIIGVGVGIGSWILRGYFLRRTSSRDGAESAEHRQQVNAERDSIGTKQAENQQLREQQQDNIEQQRVNNQKLRVNNKSARESNNRIGDILKEGKRS